MNATNKSCDIWTGETQDGFYIYTDKNGNLYESKEQPVYRITMDNATFITKRGIAPLRPRELDIDPRVANFIDEICKLGDGPISKFADKIISDQ